MKALKPPCKAMEIQLHQKTLSLIKEIRELCKVASISYGVLHHGEIILEHGIGVRDTRSGLGPDADTMYLLVSTSKTIVAAAIGILVEQGKLGWYDLIAKHMDEFNPQDDPKVAEVSTILDLLRHTSGLKNPVVSILGPNGVIISKEEDFMRVINETPVTHPNEDTYDFEYSNVGFGLAAKIIERVSGMSFARFVKESLLEPLKMSRTACTKHDVKSDDNLALPYAWDGSESFKELRCDWTDEGRPSILGSLGFRGSLNDMLVWCAATMSAENNHKFDNCGALKSRSNPLKQMDMIRNTWIDFSPRDGDREPPGYCLGWFKAIMPTSRLGWGTYNEMTQDEAECVKDEKDILGKDLEPGKVIIKHTGLGSGAAVSVWTFPETQTAVVVLSNGLNLGDASDFTAQVLTQALFDLEPKVDLLGRVKRETQLRLQHFDRTVLGQWKANFNPNTPRRAVEDFVGDYHGLGVTLRIRNINDQLLLELNGKKEATLSLTYYRKDEYSFFPQNREKWLREGWLDWDYYMVGILRFTEQNGAIAGLWWQWEETSDPTLFQRNSALDNGVKEDVKDAVV
ncbi:hypothetical protein MMC10_002563 [Thelotrema lepadinum]|nr:hypothetical protein [Thelotrema lepadinum]